MKCKVCEKETNHGSMIVGPYCTNAHLKQLMTKRQTFLDELAAEPLGEMPDQLETGDFERWSVKLGVHFLASLSDEDKKKLKAANALMMFPEQLAMDFKERILRHIKSCYVSEIDYRGHQRLFASGEYCFRQPVPKEHLLEACRKAQLISDQPGE